MKTDWLTKSLLFAIALFVGMIAVNGTGGFTSAAVGQRAPVAVDPKFGHVQLSGDQNGFYLFDTTTGRIWFYSAASFRNNPEEVGQLEEPGKRLSR
jgi:hypothetical protein